MASINKLSVRGIRAFSPEDDEQVISFCKPLTIIVGANGCGKTTIIEALKYAVTGSLPPGNKSGQAFVHDPKNIGTSQVKAAIKLRFQNRAGKDMVVIRSMELTQKKTTMSFKQLDGIIRTTDDKGNKVSLSHKCSELDRQIPQLLGVSKAILEHVVFCHQEDSSWPLMEGSVLKKRFDDIFDSTRYVKALEALKETKKGLVNKVKNLKIELAELTGHKHAAEGYRNDLDECRQKLSDIHDEINEYQKKIEQEDEKLAEYEKKRSGYMQIKQQIDAKKHQLQNKTVGINTTRAHIDNDMTETHSQQQLETMLCAFDRQKENDQNDLSAANEEIQKIEAKIKSVQELKFSLIEEKASLNGAKELYHRRMKERVESMEQLAETYGLVLTLSQLTQTQDVMGTQQSNTRHGSHSSDQHQISLSQGTFSTAATTVHLTEEDLDAFNRSVENKKTELDNDLEEYRKRCAKAEDSIQSELSDMQAKKSAIENDMKRLSSEREDAMREINTLPRSSSRMRKSEIDEAKRNRDRFVKARNDMNNDTRRQAIPQQIKDNKSKLSKIIRDIDDLNPILQDLQKCAKDQHDIDSLEIQITQELEVIEETKADNSFLLQKFHINFPDIQYGDCSDVNNAMNSILDEITDKFDIVKKDLESANEACKKSSDQLSKQSALLSHKQQRFSILQERLKSLSMDGKGVQKIKNVIKIARQFELNNYGETGVDHQFEPQQLLQYFTNKMSDFSSGEAAQPTNIIRVIKQMKSLVTELDSDSLRCPCCTRTMQEKEELRAFRTQMAKLADPETSPLIKLDKDQAASNRSALTNYENWRNLISSNMNDWMEHQRISKEIENLKAETLTEEEEVHIVRQRNEEDKEKIQSLKDKHTDLQELCGCTRHLRDDVGKIVNKRNQIISKKEILNLEAPKAGGRDLHSTEKEINGKKKEKDELINEISSFNEELSKLNENINDAAMKAAKAEKVVIDKTNQFKDEQESIDKRQQLNDKIAKCKEEEEKIKNNIGPIKQKVDMKEKEKQRVRKAGQIDLDKKIKLRSKFDSDKEKIDSFTILIDEFKNGDKNTRLDNIDIEVKKVKQTLIENQKELDEEKPKQKQIEDGVKNEEKRYKNIQQNIDMRIMIAASQDLNDEIFLLKEKMKRFDIKEIQQQISEAEDRIKTGQSSSDMLGGSKDTLQSQQRDMKRKLQTNEYRDIDERHRRKMIQTETSALAAQDLDIYYNAVDKALLRFHGIKIQEINKIIKELWTLTYRGEDITNIRLTSDQESNSRSSRSYNYRVVMTKGSTELDMRGRCSAGQRVLASIVIRLALAETFCLNCGVMALDEPTTNLDYANKRGLAVALAQIIAHRAAQDNFQLLIITHDDKFVGMMKNELSTYTGFTMPERYFQVSRQEGNDGCYYSKINCVDWDDL